MNKKILFRIWNKKEKRMLEDIHICPQYGWLVMSDNDELSEICGRVPEDDLIWMQYTGLTDKNGKKIFEGDICQGNEYSNEDNLFVIKYGKYKTDDWKEKYVSNTYQFGWYAEFINTKKQVHLVSPNGIEVIGNIFDKEVE